MLTCSCFVVTTEPGTDTEQKKLGNLAITPWLSID